MHRSGESFFRAAERVRRYELGGRERRYGDF